MTSKPALWLGLLCCALVAIAFNYFPCQLDDAFITYRYAAHLAEHGSLAFNLGEDAVEGFSSPLWMALSSAVALFLGKSAMPNAAFAMGIAFAIGACLVGYRFGSHLALRESGAAKATHAGLTSAALIALCPAVAFYAATGLEPMSFLFLVLCSFASLVGALPPWACLATAFALPWARPEALALPFLWTAMFVLNRTAERARCLHFALGAFSASFASLLVARLSIFGDWLPNTYYAKLPDRMRGIGYVLELLSTPWVAALVLLGLLGAASGGRAHKALLGCACAFFAVAALEGGDWMPLGRFALPAFGVLAVAASGVFAARARAVHAAAVVAVIVALVSGYQHTTKQLSLMHAARKSLRHEDAWLSSWIRRVEAHSIALMDIGLIGFENEVTIIDLAGLTDRTLARMAGHHLRKRIDPSYILQKRPDLIVVRTERSPFSRPGTIDPNAAMTQVEGDLLNSRAMADQYVVALMIVPGAPRDPYYGKVVFARSDFHIPRQLLPERSIFFALEPLPD